jgi:hypothetical protein
MSLREKWRWVYLLPTVHFLVTTTSLVLERIPHLNFMAFVWMFAMVVDLPISLLAYLVGWTYPTIAITWVIVAGTIWWYLLSRIAEVLFHLFASREAGPSIMQSKTGFRG